MGRIGAAAVGRAFLANPDLIDRLLLGAELNEPDAATFYRRGPVGLHRLPDARRVGRTRDRLISGAHGHLYVLQPKRRFVAIRVWR